MHILLNLKKKSNNINIYISNSFYRYISLVYVGKNVTIIPKMLALYICIVVLFINMSEVTV